MVGVGVLRGRNAFVLSVYKDPPWPLQQNQKETESTEQDKPFYGTLRTEMLQTEVAYNACT